MSHSSTRPPKRRISPKPADAAVFYFTHDLMQTPAALDNVFRSMKPGARVVATGLKWARWLSPAVNLFVRIAAMRSTTTMAGLHEPWCYLEPHLAGMVIEAAPGGATYLPGVWSEQMIENPAFSRIEVAAVSPVQILRLVLGALGATVIIGLTIEAIQSAAEFGRLAVDPVFAGAGVARGDAHTVMVIPGFLGNDNHLDTLRGWLRRIGYTPLASGLSCNTGFRREILEHLEHRAIAASQTSGTRRFAYRTQSRRRVRARDRAAQSRDRPPIRHDGSPLRVDNGPVAVPFTAVYSRTDRIVRYPRALADAGGVNAEAGGCHVGMAFNAAVYHAIAAALNSSAHASAS